MCKLFKCTGRHFERNTNRYYRYKVQGKFVINLGNLAKKDNFDAVEGSLHFTFGLSCGDFLRVFVHLFIKYCSQRRNTQNVWWQKIKCKDSSKRTRKKCTIKADII